MYEKKVHGLRWPEGNHVDCWSMETRSDMFVYTLYVHIHTEFSIQLEPTWKFKYWSFYVLICIVFQYDSLKIRRKKTTSLYHYSGLELKFHFDVQQSVMLYCIFVLFCLSFTKVCKLECEQQSRTIKVE